MPTPPQPLPVNAGVKCVMRWADNFQSITESHVYQFTAGKDLATWYYPPANSLMTLRTSMMGAGVQPISLRLSVIGSPRTYYVAPAGDIGAMAVGPAKVKVTLTPQEVLAGLTVTDADGAADVPNSCVLMNVYDASYGLHARYYMAGLPDVFIGENPSSPPFIRLGPWNTLFNNYSAMLTGGSWGWMTKIPKSTNGWGPTAVSAVGNDPTTGYFFFTAPTLGQNPPIGATVQLQGFQMNSRAYLNPNGTWQLANVVTSGPNTTYTLRGSANVQANLVFIMGTARTVGYVWTPYAKVLLGAIAGRKRGGSSLAPRGRRKTVVRVSS